MLMSENSMPANEVKYAEKLEKATQLVDEVNEDAPYNALKIVAYEWFQFELKQLIGKVLTIVDASISQTQQNKCVKDLVKSEYYNRLEALSNFYGKAAQGSQSTHLNNEEI